MRLHSHQISWGYDGNGGATSVSLHDPDGLARCHSGRFRLEVHENAEAWGRYRSYRRSITGAFTATSPCSEPVGGLLALSLPSSLASEAYSAQSPNQGRVPEYALIFFSP